MRTLDQNTLENRKRRLLQAVIYHYVQTGRPVGSQSIVDSYNFGMSSATVRNLLLELEREGFLIQPHTSAGRIPTDKGYRFYVDSLVEIQAIAASEEERIRKEYDARARELEALMTSTSRMLSNLSHYTGLVLSPRMDESLLRHLQLIALSPTKVLVVVVSQTGLIRHRMITLPRALEAKQLSQISDILNQRLVGTPVMQVRTQILDHIEAVQQEHFEMLSLAKKVAVEAFDLEESGEQVYIDGRENLSTFPDFNDYDELKNLLKVVEDKQMLTEMLQQAMTKNGLSVRIGEENKLPELRSVSLVSSTYKLGDRTVGVLGIMGPRRMEYQRMMSLVEGVTRIVNKMLAQMDRP